MSNTRRSGAYSDLQGDQRILAQGREICSLLGDGFEYEKITALLGLAASTSYRYASLWRRHVRETQPARRTSLGGTAGNKE